MKKDYHETYGRNPHDHLAKSPSHEDDTYKGVCLHVVHDTNLSVMFQIDREADRFLMIQDVLSSESKNKTSSSRTDRPMARR